MLTYIVAILCVYLFILHRRNRQKWASLDKIPGPMAIPFVGNILDISSDNKKSLDDMYKLSLKYDGIFKMNLGPLGQTVLVSDPKYFDQIMSSTVHLYKGGWYLLVKDWMGTGMITANGAQWKNARRLINPVFNTKLIEGFCCKFDARNRDFVAELKQLGEKPFDINCLIHRNSFIQMYQTLINDEVRDDQSKMYLDNCATITKMIINRFFSLKVFDFIFKRSGDYTVMQNALQALRATVADIIKERRLARKEEIKSDKKTFLDLLLDIQDENPDIPDMDIIYQVDSFMFAGHDTVAGALSLAVYELSCSREIQAKIYKESVEIFGGDLTAELTLKQLESAEYLDMFCKEVLRKYPSAPMIARQIIEPLKLGDFDIPVDTNVTMLIYCMQRNSKYYPDPLTFDPERFSSKNKGSRSEYAHSPFSHGPRNCIGQRFGLAQMKSTITMLLRNFIIFKGDPDFEVSVGQAGTLIILNGVLIRLQQR